MTTVGTHSAEPVPRRPVCLDSTRKRRLLNGQGVEPTAHNAPTSLNPTTEETLVPGGRGPCGGHTSRHAPIVQERGEAPGSFTILLLIRQGKASRRWHSWTRLPLAVAGELARRSTGDSERCFAERGNG